MQVDNVLQFDRGSSRDRNIAQPKIKGLPFIPIGLDDANLSLEAFRVFCCLCRRAQLEEGEYKVYYSQESIGNICFAGSYPNAQGPQMRKRTNKAIGELEARGMIEVTRSRSGNSYQINSSEKWIQPDKDWINPNQRIKTRSQEDLEHRSQGDLEHRSHGDLHGGQSVAEQGFQAIDDELDIKIQNELRRSQGDHNGEYIEITNPEEREINFLNLFPVNPDSGAIQAEIEEPQIVAQQDFEGSDHSLFSEQISRSEPKRPAVEPIESTQVDRDSQSESEIDPEASQTPFFDPASYDWSEYTGPSSSVAPRAFYEYVERSVLLAQAQRAKTFHPSPIGDVAAYTCATIRKQGLARYLAWQAKCRESIAPEVREGLVWGPDAPWMQIDLAMSLVRSAWKELGLGWENADLLVWMKRAEQLFEGFKFAQQSLYSLPDLIVFKLAQDLQLTIQRNLGILK